TSATVLVHSGPAVALFFEGVPSNAKTSGGIGFPVFALDAFNNPATTYNGTLHFTTDCLLAVLPADYTYVPPSDHGSHFFALQLQLEATYTTTATDTSDSSLTLTSTPISVVNL